MCLQLKRHIKNGGGSELCMYICTSKRFPPSVVLFSSACFLLLLLLIHLLFFCLCFSPVFFSSSVSVLPFGVAFLLRQRMFFVFRFKPSLLLAVFLSFKFVGPLCCAPRVHLLLLLCYPLCCLFFFYHHFLRCVSFFSRALLCDPLLAVSCA